MSVASHPVDAASLAEGRVEALAPGVFALSRLVDLARPISWVAPGSTGYDPATVYLVVDGEHALLVDTGLRAHRDTILRQLQGLLEPGQQLAVALTRIEPDCVANLEPIMASYRVERLYAACPVHPLELLGPLPAQYQGTEPTWMARPGDVLPLGDRPRFEVVGPPVYSLATNWLFDRETGVLFTSDFFGHVQVDAAWQPVAPATPERVRAHLPGRFDWLLQADTSMPAARLGDLFARYPVRALAPGHGLWTLGGAAVREAAQLTRHAVAALGVAAATR